MKRVLAVIAGLLALLLGVASVALAGGVLAYFGTEGRHDVPVATVTTQGAALYVRAFGLDQSVIPEGTVDVSLSAAAADGREVFLGVGKAADVQQYLTGVPYDAATELRAGAFTINAVPGLRVPAPAPADQQFWIASTAGAPADLPWSDAYRADVLVAMNADGSAPVNLSLSAALTFERALTTIIAAAVVGLVLLVLAGWLLLRAGRKRRSSTPSAG